MTGPAWQLDPRRRVQVWAGPRATDDPDDWTPALKNDQRWLPRDQVDELTIDHALAGYLPARKLTHAERRIVVRHLTQTGLTSTQIATRLRITQRSVERLINRPEERRTA